MKTNLDKPFEVLLTGTPPMVSFELDDGQFEGFEYMALSRITLAADNSVITLYFSSGTVTLRLRAIKDDDKEVKEAKEKQLHDLYRHFLKHAVFWVRTRNEIITSVTFEIKEEEEFAGMNPVGAEGE